MAGHSNASLGARHPIHNWEYADAVARAAATGFNSSDIGKVSKQLDNDTLWQLTSISPTWKQIDSFGGSLVDSWAYGKHIESDSVAYSVKAEAIFRGTAAMGIPTTVKLLAKCKDDCVGWIRLHCNGQVIAETSLTYTNPTILDMGALANLPTEESIVEVQLKIVGGGSSAEVEVYSLHWYY